MQNFSIHDKLFIDITLICEGKAIVFRDRKCQASCFFTFYHHLAVHKVDLGKVLNIYIRKGIYV